MPDDSHVKVHNFPLNKWDVDELFEKTKGKYDEVLIIGLREGQDMNDAEIVSSDSMTIGGALLLLSKVCARLVRGDFG